jgi:hypothetical protein
MRVRREEWGDCRGRMRNRREKTAAVIAGCVPVGKNGETVVAECVNRRGNTAPVTAECGSIGKNLEAVVAECVTAEENSEPVAAECVTAGEIWRLSRPNAGPSGRMGRLSRPNVCPPERSGTCRGRMRVRREKWSACREAISAPPEKIRTQADRNPSSAGWILLVSWIAIVG